MATRRGSVRRMCVVAVACAVLGVGWTPATVVADGPAGMAGNGAAEDPFEISTVDQLQAIEEDLDAHYELVGDVDASKASAWNKGDGFEPIGDSKTPFTGSLDGNGYEIVNLFVDRVSRDSVGLFNRVGSGGTVENVVLTNVDVTGTYAGGLVGMNYGTIRNVSIQGTVDSVEESGGVVRINHGTVTRAAARTSATSDNGAGGLFYSNLGTVRQSVARGDVSGSSVGGLMWYNSDGSDVGNSFATGTVESSYKAGGLVGNDGGTTTGSYWDTETTGQGTTDGGGTGLTTARMTGTGPVASMSTFDFEDDWLLTDGYPRLRWTVESLTVATGTASLGPGESTDATVVAAFVDGSTDTATSVATYASNDSGVATVDSTGTVTAVAPGTATITADVNGTVASTTVSVVDETDPVARAGSNLTVRAGETVAVDGSASSDDSGVASHQWDFGNGETDTGSTANHTYDAPGTYTVTLAVTDAAGNTGRDTLSVTVEATESGGTARGYSPVAPDLPIPQGGSIATSGQEVAVSFGDQGGGVIRETALTFEQGQGKLRAVDRPEDLPAGLPSTDGAFLGAVDLTVSSAESPTLDLVVSRAAPSVRDRDPAALRVEHFDEDAGNWETLQTTVVESTDAEVVLRVTAPEFSTFAVTAPPAVESETRTTDTATAPATTATPTDTGTEAPTATRTPTTTAGSDGPGFGVGLAVLSLLAVVCVARRRG